MEAPSDGTEEFKTRRLTARFIFDEAEVLICNDNPRDLCVMAEKCLRYLHALGIQPDIIAEGNNITDLVTVEGYINGVLREIESNIS